MKNLKEHVQKIYDASQSKNFDQARQLCHEMVDFSDAKRLTKVKYHLEIDRLPDWKIEWFAGSYWLSGEGHKVIK